MSGRYKRIENIEKRLDVVFTRAELVIMNDLIRSESRVVPYETLIKKLYGDEGCYQEQLRALHLRIWRLNQKLKPAYTVVTVRGRGIKIILKEIDKNY